MYKLIYEERTVESNVNYTTSSSPSYSWKKKIRFFDFTSSSLESDFNSTIEEFLATGEKRFVDFIKIKEPSLSTNKTYFIIYPVGLNKPTRYDIVEVGNSGKFVGWTLSLTEAINLIENIQANMKPESKCTCDPSLLTPERELDRFNQMVSIELPLWSSERKRRVKEGMNTNIAVDPCIVEDIKFLWSKGIETLGCCCGHNVLPATVGVSKQDEIKMENLGYKYVPEGMFPKNNVFILFDNKNI